MALAASRPTPPFKPRLAKLSAVASAANKGSPPPTPTPVRVIKSEIHSLQQLCGQAFTLDACAHSTDTAVCENFCSTSHPFTQHPVQGHHVWLHFANASDLTIAVDHYVTQKALSPHNTSACVLIPKTHKSAVAALKNMRLIKQYSKGYHLFQKGNKRLAGLQVPMEVYYDPPTPSLPNTPASKRLAMQFACKIAGCKGNALLDTGAKGLCYLSAQFCLQNGISITPIASTSQQVAFIDGTPATNRGTATVNVHIQGYAAKLECTVLDMMPGYELVLGDQWLTLNDAVLHMSLKKCVLHCPTHTGKAKKVVTLSQARERKTLSTHQPPSHVAEDSVNVISAIHVARLARKQKDLDFLLVLVDKAEGLFEDDSESHSHPTRTSISGSYTC